MSSFKEFIRNNPSILKTLFHVDDDGIKVIDNNSREIIKNYRTAKLFRFLPILKDILQEILKDISTIKLIIIETFDVSNNSFNYEIKVAENKLFENITNIYKFRYYIHLTLDKKNKNKINSSLSMNKNDVDDDYNPINKVIIMIMLNYFENEHPNYYKKVILEEKLKPLITAISHHSFELNII
jgi:hypothetical protein